MANRSLNHNQELAQLVDQWTREKGTFETSIMGLTLYRAETLTQPSSSMMDASLCMIAQGKKQVILSEETYTYDSNHFLFTAIDLPVIAQVLEA
ncbi:MAG: AraC family transcriptional regulator, partial [Acinetobacter calcoaceticus]